MEDTYRRAEELVRSGDASQAVPLLEEITRQEPENWRAFLYLGVAYAKNHRYETAIGALRRATQLNDNVPSTHYNLAQICELAGVPEEAEHEYNQALQLDPDYEMAVQGLERVRKKLDAQQGDTEGF